MYKIASDNAQRRASKLTLADLQPAAPLVLTPEEERASLVARTQQIEQELKTCTDKARRKELGQEKFLLCTRISGIRRKPKCPDASQRFIDAARELLPRYQFNAVMAEAARRAREAEATAQDVAA
jgi:hypothetical protein